ncbi:helix-turn-helix domain-containing protein [Streptomyces sp. NPDC004012]
MADQAENFGALLRRLRLAASLTIEELSEASGVSVRGIGELERGRRGAPQRRTVAALADGLAPTGADRERLLAAARAGRTPGYSPVGVRTSPRGIDDFVGREQELAQLTALAREHGRLAVEQGERQGGDPARDSVPSRRDPVPDPAPRGLGAVPGPGSRWWWRSPGHRGPERRRSRCRPPGNSPTGSRTGNWSWTCAVWTRTRRLPPS